MSWDAGHPSSEAAAEMTRGGQLTPEESQRWLRSWDEQQNYYAVDRDERWEAVLDVIGPVLQPGVDVVVDLGCGPGTLTARVAERYPGISVVGVDGDPFLIQLAAAAHPHHATWMELRFDTAGWADALALAGPVRAVVTSSALHYLDEPALAAVYRDLASVIAPGGLLVNADHLLPHNARSHPLLRAVRASPLTASGDEPWRRWWSDIATDPVAGPLLARYPRAGLPAGDHDVPAERHVELLEAAGFGTAETVWRHGISAVLVAVR